MVLNDPEDSGWWTSTGELGGCIGYSEIGMVVLIDDAVERKTWRVWSTIYISVAETPPEDFVGLILGVATEMSPFLAALAWGLQAWKRRHWRC